MACYAIIPARGGSKEVLKKNLRKINGKSLISRCIQTAKKSKFINKIYVSSDDLPRVLNGLGISIITTSVGVVSNKKAKRLSVGGEVLCYVW